MNDSDQIISRPRVDTNAELVQLRAKNAAQDLQLAQQATEITAQAARLAHLEQFAVIGGPRTVHSTSGNAIERQAFPLIGLTTEYQLAFSDKVHRGAYSRIDANHSSDVSDTFQHLHLHGALLRDSAYPGNDVYKGGQIRSVVKSDGRREVQEILYYADPNKVPDFRHPNFETDPNIRITKVSLIKTDGVFNIQDTDLRRALQ